MMRKLLLLFALLICWSTAIFAESPKQIVFFGDSLSDNGNLYRAIKIMPKSPPYFKGRFSNGYTWADNIAEYYFQKYNTPTQNYAVGGATALLHDPFEGFLPYTVGEEIDQFLLYSIGKDLSKTLFVIWIGANDYFSENGDVEQLTTQVTTEINEEIIKLIKHGAQNFLVLNLPDLAKTPYFKNVSYKDKVHAYSIAHNKKLADIINKLQSTYKNMQFTLFDIGSLVDDILQNPQKYNQLYKTNFQNLTDSCWTGGYTVPKNQAEKSLETELQNTFVSGILNKNMNASDIISISQHLLSSPDTLQAYETGKAYEMGIEPCDKPDQYFFWDKLHPTGAAHDLLSQLIIHAIDPTSLPVNS